MPSKDYSKEKQTAFDVYDACHEKVKKYGQTEDTWKNCVGTAAMPLLTVAFGPGAPAARVVVEFVAGGLYKIGAALGLSNSEEEARMHAEQSAAWASYKTAWENVDKLNVLRDENGHPVLNEQGVVLSSGDEAYSRAVVAVAKMRKDNGLGPRKFFFFWPIPSAAAFYESIGVGPGDSSPDAGKIVTYAWKASAQKFFDEYATWFEKLNTAVEREAAEIAITKGLNTKIAKKSSAVPVVLAVGAAAVAAWWFLPTVLLENPLPSGATLRKEGGWWVLRFREGGYREFKTKQDAERYLGGLSR